MAFAEYVQKAVVGVAGTVLCAFGGMVVSTKVEQGVQRTQIATVTQHQADEDATLKHLDDTVQALDKNVAVMSDRIAHGKR